MRKQLQKIKHNSIKMNTISFGYVRLKAYCNTAVSRAQGGARRCCCQPFTRRDALPVQVYCRAQHRARWSATVSVETDAETRPAWSEAGGLLISPSAGWSELHSARPSSYSGRWPSNPAWRLAISLRFFKHKSNARDWSPTSQSLDRTGDV